MKLIKETFRRINKKAFFLIPLGIGLITGLLNAALIISTSMLPTKSIILVWYGNFLTAILPMYLVFIIIVFIFEIQGIQSAQNEYWATNKYKNATFIWVGVLIFNPSLYYGIVKLELSYILNYILMGGFIGLFFTQASYWIYLKRTHLRSKPEAGKEESEN